MTIQIVRWGNSQGVRLPKALLDSAGLAAGDMAELRLEDGRIIIERIKQGVFVPVATQYIFAKFFDKKGTNRSLWTQEDMEAYHQYVYDIITNYLSEKEEFV